ncbi:MAG: AEC family transporter [Alphaproteobacteria bacterium]|nr:AEC family transporter [Alphaproteobacteria bacterium]
MFLNILAIIAPVLIIAMIGFGWRRAGQPFHTDMVSALVVTLGTPCLLVSKLLAERPDLTAMGHIALAAVLITAAMALTSGLALKALRLPVRVYLPAMIFPNAGNMGLPLCLFAFGDAGLALAITYFTCNALMQFSIGQGIARGNFNAKVLARDPVAWAVLLAVILLATKTNLPNWAMNTADVLGGIVLPLMMLSLGISLASLKIADLRRSLVVSVIRLAGGFAFAYLVTAALGLEGPERGVVLIQASMPPAVFNYMFALRYYNQPGEVAGVVLVSTVMSFATLPLLLAFVLSVTV